MYTTLHTFGKIYDINVIYNIYIYIYIYIYVHGCGRTMMTRGFLAPVVRAKLHSFRVTCLRVLMAIRMRSNRLHTNDYLLFCCSATNRPTSVDPTVNPSHSRVAYCVTAATSWTVVVRRWPAFPHVSWACFTH